jgi:hypothetical protein
VLLFILCNYQPKYYGCCCQLFFVLLTIGSSCNPTICIYNFYNAFSAFLSIFKYMQLKKWSMFWWNGHFILWLIKIYYFTGCVFFLIFRNFALQNFLYLIEICLSVCLAVCHERKVGSNGDNYSCGSYFVWKLDSSSFRKCKFFRHGSPLTPINFGVIEGWCEEIAVFFRRFRKFAAINFLFWIWILYIRMQLENSHNFCAGCTLWVKNWRNGITLKLRISTKFALWNA